MPCPGFTYSCHVSVKNRAIPVRFGRAVKKKISPVRSDNIIIICSRSPWVPAVAERSGICSNNVYAPQQGTKKKKQNVVNENTTHD